MRTFVAIELPDSIRWRLAEAIGELKDLGGRVRWQRPETMHLTLKFIGDLDDQAVPDAIAALEKVAAGSASFEMFVEGLSGFPPHGTPRVVHVPVAEPTGMLAQLQKNVDRELSRELGIDREGRDYIPHITLGRVKNRRKAPALSRMRDALQQTAFGTFEAEAFILFKSDLRPDGAVHTPVHEFEFKG
jgi:2'-5' RNA ligase